MATPAVANSYCCIDSRSMLSVDLNIYFVFQKKKKTITDVLASSEPKPGCPADLQNLVAQYFSDKRSVIELEELKLHGESGRVRFNAQSICVDLLIHQGHCLHLPDSCFLSSNDLTHSLSSYLKQGERCLNLV